MKATIVYNNESFMTDNKVNIKFKTLPRIGESITIQENKSLFPAKDTYKVIDIIHGFSEDKQLIIISVV